MKTPMRDVESDVFAELAARFDDEPMCQIDHEQLVSDPDYTGPTPPCGIVASAKLIACHTMVLICRPLVESVDPVTHSNCSVCGGPCTRIDSL